MNALFTIVSLSLGIGTTRLDPRVDPKRERARAVQKLSQTRTLPVHAKRFGVRQSSAALDSKAVPGPSVPKAGAAQRVAGEVPLFSMIR